jgi:hypothetical protein
MPDVVVLPLLVSTPALVLIGVTIADAARRTDLTAAGRTGWIVAAILLPVLGTFAYLLARPMTDPARDPATINPRTAELVDLIRRHEAGGIPAAAYQAAKRRLFSHAASDEVA